MVENRTRWTLLSGICAAMLVSFQMAVGAEAGNQHDDEASRRVLLITGEDYPGHQWRETAPVLLAELYRDSRLTVDVLADLESLQSTKLDHYASVVLHFKNYDPTVPGRDGFDNLANYVKQGGGLVLLHFACGAFEEFKDDFEPLAGRVWFGQQPPPGRHQHDPRGKFTVSIARTDHPITQGMKDFETVDELYTCLEGEVPITPLVTAVSKVDGKTYPIAFVLSSGEGRVFHCVLGHDVKALSAAGPAELIRRGTAWTAGLDPAPRGESSR
ncbi:MAG: ThuA domain-containing protein [Pirellulaceae bacterium]